MKDKLVGSHKLASHHHRGGEEAYQITVPVRYILVRDARRDIEHDNRAPEHQRRKS